MTRGFARILVPTDFSPPSDAALATAKALAAQFGASIHLIHVLHDPYADGRLCQRRLRISALRAQRVVAAATAQTHLDALLTPPNGRSST